MVVFHYHAPLQNAREAVLREVGIDVSLIYGDFEDGEVVLYSPQPLKGYEKVNGVYRKRVRPDDPLIALDTNFYILTQLGQSSPWPRENYSWRLDSKTPVVNRPERPEEEAELFGTGGSFGYSASLRLIKKLDEDKSLFLSETGYPPTDFPYDIILVHEGVHCGTHLHQRVLFPKYSRLVDASSGYLRQEQRKWQVYGSTAMLPELKYLIEHHPELEGRWRDMRKSHPDPVRKEAYRLVVERPDDIERILEKIRNRNHEDAQIS